MRAKEREQTQKRYINPTNPRKREKQNRKQWKIITKRRKHKRTIRSIFAWMIKTMENCVPTANALTNVTVNAHALYCFDWNDLMECIVLCFPSARHFIRLIVAMCRIVALTKRWRRCLQAEWTEQRMHRDNEPLRNSLAWACNWIKLIALKQRKQMLTITLGTNCKV